MQAVGAAHLGHQLAVDDDELQAELVAHLVLPLQRQARRAHDHRGAGPMPQEQLLQDQAGLDGLAQADVVGQQQVGPRAGQRAAQRFKLVGLHRDARPERCLVAVRVGRGDRAPAHGVDEARQGDGVVEAFRVDVLRQTLRRGDGLADLQLPDHRQLLAESVLVEGLQVDDVVELRGGVVGRAERKALGLDVGDCPRGAAYLDDLTGFWQGRGGYRHR